MKHIFILCSFVCLSLAASAQTMSLDECRSSALEHNLTLKNARLEWDSSRQTRKEALTKYFPTITAQGMVFQAQHGMVQMDVPVPLPSFLPIPSGGIELPLSVAKRGIVGGIVAVQPVFAGLKIINGNKLARVGEEVSALNLQKSEREVNTLTDTYFWQVISLRENLATLDAVDRQLDEITRQVELSLKAGLVTKNDLLRVDLRRQEVASSRLKLESGIHVAKMLLAHHVGVDWRGFDVTYGEFADPQDPATYYVPTDQALDLRAEYALAQKNVEAHKYQKRMERGKNLPTLGVGAGYLHTNVTEKNVNNGVVFAELSLPISQWWGGAHAIKRARLKEQMAENSMQKAREMLTIEIEKTWSELQVSYQQIAIARRSVASSAENLRQMRQFYSVGTSSLTDLLDAETLHTRSQYQLTEALASYQTALSEYLRVTGR